MKIRVLDRILVALAGLLMLVSGAALAAQLFFGKDVAGTVANWLNDDGLRVYIIIGGLLMFGIGVYCVLLLFRHKGRNDKFIVQRTDSGELAISLKALESMVLKCLEPHKELTAESVSLDNQKGSLVIKIRGTVAGGISIPLTVDTLQQQIKQYVTACSGVEVRDIQVEIESSGPDAKNAPFAIEAPVAKGLLNGAEEEATEQAEQAEQAEQKIPENPETAGAEQQEKAVPSDSAEGKNQDEELTAAAAAAALVMDQAPAEEDDRPMHQRLFSTVEEPCVMPMPPMNRDEGTEAATSSETEEPAKAPEAETPKTEEATKAPEAETPKTEEAAKAPEAEIPKTEEAVKTPEIETPKTEEPVKAPGSAGDADEKEKNEINEQEILTEGGIED